MIGWTVCHGRICTVIALTILHGQERAANGVEIVIEAESALVILARIPSTA